MFDADYYLRMLKYSSIGKITKQDVKVKSFLIPIKFEKFHFLILFQFYLVCNLIATETLLILSPILVNSEPFIGLTL